MRIVIAGAGRQGLALATHLQDRGHEVVVIERDSHAATRAVEEHGLVVLRGDATDASLLAQSEPARADVMLAMLPRDADNVAVTVLARSLGAGRVMARARDARYRDAYARAGANATLSETHVVIGALGVAVEHAAVRHAMPLGDGEEVAVEIQLPAGARCVGRSIAELARAPDFPPRCVVVAAGTDGPLEVARGATTLASEARVLFVAPRADLGPTLAFFLRP